MRMTANHGSRSTSPARAGSLAEWLLRQGLLRGPFLFVDYWASVLRFAGAVPEEQIRVGLVDETLFRLGLDRPDLEVPRLRYYLLLFLVGPLLLPFRFFRRLGRYRIRFRRAVGDEVLSALRRYRLSLVPSGRGRVDVSKDGIELADDVLDPYLIAGFASPFFAAYKLPLASLSGILLVAALVLLLGSTGPLGPVGDHLLLAGFPLLVIALYAVYREWVTAVLGATPVLLGAVLVDVLRFDVSQDWVPFLGALGGLFAVYLLIDWFFMPRPVPPVLFLYCADGPGRPYRRQGDAPYWLTGRVYWVWRYLMLTPAELNKFWERDWERVELWIRADGPTAGALEWVVTDAHYRELWIPYEKLGFEPSLARNRIAAVRAAQDASAGTWLLEVDANQLFHSPFFRAVSFLPERGRIPVRRVGHMVKALWKQARDDRVDDYLEILERLQVREGVDILEDVPELIAHLTARHMLSQPWRYWRYPLGANRRLESRLYEGPGTRERAPAAAPELQIKAMVGVGPPGREAVDDGMGGAGRAQGAELAEPTAKRPGQEER